MNEGNIQVTQRIEFECAYFCEGEFNSHRYKLEATVEGPERFEEAGIVLSFADFKSYLRSVCPRNGFIVNTLADASEIEKVVKKVWTDYKMKLYEVKFSVCAETLCMYIANKLQETLATHEPKVKLVDLKLRETQDSYVSWSSK